MDIELISKFNNILKSNYSELKITPKYITLDDVKTSKVKFPKELENIFRSLALDYPEVIEHKDELPEICRRLSAHMLEAEEENKAKEKFQVPFEVNPEDKLVIGLLDSHSPVVDVATGRYGLVPNGTKGIAPISISLYKDMFEGKEWREVVKVMPQTLFIYDTSETPPKTQELSTPLGIETYPTRNLYIPPRWTFEENKYEDLDEDHKTMIFSRFEGEESLERYFCALYHMLTGRNKTLIGLVHKREGTGKSTVMGKIPGYLVGMDNTSYTDKNFMASPHKDAFLNKRMIFLDEHRLTSGQESIEKQFVEDMLYINPKGRSSMTITNTLSFFMASNNEGDIYTSPTNRRHVFLEDSGRHIIEEQGAEWMTNYMKRLKEDMGFVANLGYYILNNFKEFKYGPDATYRGPSFERIVRATCHTDFSDIVDAILSGNEGDISYNDRKSSYYKASTGSKRGHYPKVQTFIDFFTAFRWEGEAICRVERDDIDNDVILEEI